MRRLPPGDDLFIGLDTDASPQQIGALQYYYDLQGRSGGDFHHHLVAHLRRRLPGTPLLSTLCHAPLRFDGDVWVELAGCDIDQHVERVDLPAPVTEADVQHFVEQRVVQRLDLGRPPFRMFVLGPLADGRGALHMLVHHSVVDGVGFQNLMAALTDPGPAVAPGAPARRRDERPPPAPWWLARSAARFGWEWARRRRPASVERAAAARQAYDAYRKAPAHRRAPTPVLGLSRSTSDRRRYGTLSLDLDLVKQAATALGGSINDVFLGVAAGALHQYLAAQDDLPAQPLVALSAMSYRRPEHGPYGARIITLNPAIHVEIADPLERFAATQASVAVEIARARLTEPLIDDTDRPFGARRRAEAAAARSAADDSVLVGNVTLSNVPGPSEPVYLAGYQMLANYPTPILGRGRFLNITLRRYRQHLDLGIMADPAQLTDPELLQRLLVESLQELATLR